MRVSRAFILLALAAILPLAAQSKREFEAASVKPAPHLSPDEIKSDPGKIGTTISAGLVHMPYARMDNILVRAFDTTAHQVVAPEWTKSKNYSIEAKIPEGSSPSDVPEMLRNLLASRFGMTYHRETRPTEVQTLTAKGLKAKPAEREEPVRQRAAKDLDRYFGFHYEMATTFAGLAEWLYNQIHLPVLNKAGLQGIYQFSFDCFPGGGISVETKHIIAPPDTRLTFDENQALWFAEGLDKIGVRLASAKTPLENFIVDRLESVPTEN